MTRPLGLDGGWTLALALVVFGTGCASPRVRPGDMSVRDHETAAAEDSAEAGRHAERYDPKAVRYTDVYPESLPGCDKTLAGSCSPMWSMRMNPTDRELALAVAHKARARQHRAAARALRDTEARACANVSPSDRDISPFQRRRDIRFVMEIGASGGNAAPGPAGAAVVFGPVPGLTATTLERIVECHLARYAALGFDQSENTDCPLNVRGASAIVRTLPDGLAVEITSTDAAGALEISRRVRALGGEPVVAVTR